ncbi:MAG: hypothetical protein Kow0079_02840 [Vicingaceae bacterium]
MPDNKRNPFLRFMGMGAQILAPILVGVFLGKYLDEYFGYNKLFKISLTLFGVFAGMYIVIKEVISINKDE